MAKDHDKSLGDQNTFDGGVKRVESSQQSLGDQSTFGGGDASSMAELDGLAGGADLEMEIVDLAARYTTEGTLGKGGMGEVLLALDTRLKRKVAIKRILGEGARSQTALSRFSTEAQSIAALNHPNIVQIYDYGRDEDGPFLIMEYVDGGSLLEKCKEGALELEEAVELTCQLCDGLGKAHEAGIIHRDIKPANVLLTNDGTPKLTDFGLARQDTADHGQTQVGSVLGTIDFMPPEQRRGATETDARSDLWSLAATLYQMVTGKSPKIIKFNNVPQALQDVLGKALEDEQDDRYQTAAEFRDALRASQKAQTAPAPVGDADLDEGVCSKCHTKNDLKRKYCRNSTCAASLRVDCLKCAEEIPVWDKVCAECGGKQIELAEACRAELDTQREKAESLRSEYAFDESLVIAREIAAVEDSRLQHLKEWSETFIDETETEKVRQEQNAAAHYAEAKTHREAYDYKSAIHAIQAVPEAMRTSEMAGYLQELETDHDESEELIKTISGRIKRRDLEGLLEQVERAVELRGDHADLLKLQAQLNERLEKLIKQRDAAYTEASSLLNEGQAKKAYRLICRVKTQDLRASDVKLRTQLEEIVAAEDALTALVKESKADGVLDPDEVAAMWKSTDEYLKLNPRHEKIAEMQQQLVDRIERAPADYAAFGELVDFWPKQPDSGPPPSQASPDAEFLDSALGGDEEAVDEELAKLNDDDQAKLDELETHNQKVSTEKEFQTVSGVVNYAGEIARESDLLGEQYYFKPNIPPHLAVNAIKSYCRLPCQPDDILVLCDNTVFRNGKKGFIMTDKFISWNEPNLGNIELSQLQEVRYTDRPHIFSTASLFLDGWEIHVNGPSVKITNFFLDLMANMLTTIVDDTYGNGVSETS